VARVLPDQTPAGGGGCPPAPRRRLRGSNGHAPDALAQSEATRRKRQQATCCPPGSDAAVFPSCWESVPKPSSLQWQRWCPRRASTHKPRLGLSFVSRRINRGRHVGRTGGHRETPSPILHLAGGATALPAVSRIARAQAYPKRPVTMITPFAVGGSTDVIGEL
jgi:hypothetical protein